MKVSTFTIVITIHTLFLVNLRWFGTQFECGTEMVVSVSYREVITEFKSIDY